MSTVLVVQPDEVQADVLRQIFAKRVGAELVMVDSTMEAVDEIARRMPDLILLSALLSPRDEDALIAHLRSLDGASHLQTITIPQFRTGPAKAPEKKGGLFRRNPSRLRRSDAIRWRLPRKLWRTSRPPVKSAIGPGAKGSPNVSRRRKHPLIEDEAANRIGVRHHPFQSHYVAPAPDPSCRSLMAEPVMAGAEIEPVAESAAPLWKSASSKRAIHRRGALIDLPRPAAWPRSIEIDEIDQLARELGLNLKYVEQGGETSHRQLARSTRETYSTSVRRSIAHATPPGPGAREMVHPASIRSDSEAPSPRRALARRREAREAVLPTWHACKPRPKRCARRRCRIPRG